MKYIKTYENLNNRKWYLKSCNNDDFKEYYEKIDLVNEFYSNFDIQARYFILDDESCVIFVKLTNSEFNRYFSDFTQVNINFDKTDDEMIEIYNPIAFIKKIELRKNIDKYNL